MSYTEGPRWIATANGNIQLLNAEGAIIGDFTSNLLRCRKPGDAAPRAQIGAATVGDNPGLMVLGDGTGNEAYAVFSGSGRFSQSCTGTAAPVAGDFLLNEMFMVTRASDTSLRFSMKGADGVVRSGTLALS